MFIPSMNRAFVTLVHEPEQVASSPVCSFRTALNQNDTQMNRYAAPLGYGLPTGTLPTMNHKKHFPYNTLFSWIIQYIMYSNQAGRMERMAYKESARKTTVKKRKTVKWRLSLWSFTKTVMLCGSFIRP